MGFEVVLRKDVERDLEERYDPIAASDSRENADYVLDRLLETAQARTAFPERGVLPKERRS
jgi:plasmid stabilization system protein ParE